MAVGVAQLVEWSLPTQEVRGSDPFIDNSYWYFLSTVLKRLKIHKVLIRCRE